jgi:site-specific recombinase XerC
MLEMGLRPEEVFELHARHVHLNARPPYVHIPEGKSAKARRDVPITAKAMAVLHKRLTVCDAREPRDAQWNAYIQKTERRFSSRKAFNRATDAERDSELRNAGVSEHEVEQAKERLRARGRGYLFPQRVCTGRKLENGQTKYSS